MATQNGHTVLKILLPLKQVLVPPTPPSLAQKLAAHASFAQEKKKLKPPFSQALLPLSLQWYCSGSKPLLTLLSKIAEKKISKIFASIFRILFSKSLLTFWSEKGFQISIFLPCITTAKRKKILSLLAASLETRAQKWPCVHTCSQLFPALIAWLEKIFVRAQNGLQNIIAAIRLSDADASATIQFQH